MPVRSLNSSVLVWPDRRRVHGALVSWARAAAAERPRLRRVGYIGSYARGDWGVGSDLDLVLVVAQSDLPFERRPTRWDVNSLPVPADTLVYTCDEWDALAGGDTAFGRVLREEAVWVYPDEA